MFNKRLLVIGLVAASTGLVMGCKEKKEEAVELTTLSKKPTTSLAKTLAATSKTAA